MVILPHAISAAAGDGNDAIFSLSDKLQFVAVVFFDNRSLYLSVSFDKLKFVGQPITIEESNDSQT